MATNFSINVWWKLARNNGRRRRGSRAYRIVRRPRHALALLAALKRNACESASRGSCSRRAGGAWRGGGARTRAAANPFLRGGRGRAAGRSSRTLVATRLPGLLESIAQAFNLSRKLWQARPGNERASGLAGGSTCVSPKPLARPARSRLASAALPPLRLARGLEGVRATRSPPASQPGSKKAPARPEVYQLSALICAPSPPAFPRTTRRRPDSFHCHQAAMRAAGPTRHSLAKPVDGGGARGGFVPALIRNACERMEALFVQAHRALPLASS